MFLGLWVEGSMGLWHHFVSAISSQISETIQNLLLKFYMYIS